MDKLSVIIPGRNEEENLESCISEIFEKLDKHQIIHEILVVDDGSTDNTPILLQQIVQKYPTVRCLRNDGENGFGRAVRLGLTKIYWGCSGHYDGRPFRLASRSRKLLEQAARGI